MKITESRSGNKPTADDPKGVAALTSMPGRQTSSNDV